MTGGQQPRPSDAGKVTHEDASPVGSGAPNKPAPQTPDKTSVRQSGLQETPESRGLENPPHVHTWDSGETKQQAMPSAQKTGAAKGCKNKTKKKRKRATSQKETSISQSEGSSSTSGPANLPPGEAKHGAVSPEGRSAGQTKGGDVSNARSQKMLKETPTEVQNDKEWPKFSTDDGSKMDMEIEDESLVVLQDMGDWATLLEEEPPEIPKNRATTTMPVETSRGLLTKSNLGKRSACKRSAEISAAEDAEKTQYLNKKAKRAHKSSAAFPERQDRAVAGLSQQLLSIKIEEIESSETSDAVFPPPTSGEMERLCWVTLEEGLPRHFSTKSLRSKRVNGRVVITNPHTLVTGCPIGITYTGLFGKLTDGGYQAGPVVKTLDHMVPFLKKKSEQAIKKARGYLKEAYIIRTGELRKKSKSYDSHLYMVHVLRGTLDYLDELVRWLDQVDANPWVPWDERPSASR
ncbi:uncharacterized protein LOC122375846 isoform X1 [Amphibalanus amphitrite]|uniref:uncharacterized protein LOC122375846 isoform X1 n=1 Tax=Amphibalanus amphitrite TaxID=1232801 RepID=UPI001C8FECC4|nr:uncharacterized protein LOC122375846 isoform X1 [Amphibalanus amphitrite]